MTETTTGPEARVSPQESDALVAVADVLTDALQVRVSPLALAPLQPRERQRLRALASRLRETPEPDLPRAVSPDERHRAAAFADALDRTPVATPDLKHELRLLAQYVRQIDRMPSA